MSRPGYASGSYAPAPEWVPMKPHGQLCWQASGLAWAPHFPGSLFRLFCHLKEQVLRAEVWLIYPQKQVCLPSPVSVEAVGGPEGRGSWGGRASGRPPSPGDCVQAGPCAHHPGVPGRSGSAEAGQAPDGERAPRRIGQ